MASVEAPFRWVSAETVFALSAFVTSLSWQGLLVVVDDVAHHALPGRFQLIASIVGNLIVLDLAVVAAVRWAGVDTGSARVGP